MMQQTKKERDFKRLALRCFIVLLMVLTLCMLLSGTIKTLTTAKVKLIMPSSNYLAENIQTTGYLHFSDTSELLNEAFPRDVTLTIRKVYVTPGRRVSAGDVLFEAEVDDFDSAMLNLSSEYNATAEELIRLQLDNASLHLTSNDEVWINAFDAYLAAQCELRDAEILFTAEATSHGITLVDGKLPDGISDDSLLNHQAIIETLLMQVDEQRCLLDDANRIGIQPTVRSYIMQERKLQNDLNALQHQMTVLLHFSDMTHEVMAPHDGFVLAVNIKEGESFNGIIPAVVMSGESSECYLQADVSGTSRVITEGTPVVMTGNTGYQISGTVTGNGFDNFGNATIQIAIPSSAIATLGGASNLLNKGASMTVEYLSDKVRTLIPAASVRGSRGNNFIYAVEETENLLGQRVLTLTKQTVTILDEAGGMVAVLEAIDNLRIAYMEDRSISEGSEVIPYDD